MDFLHHYLTLLFDFITSLLVGMIKAIKKYNKIPVPKQKTNINQIILTKVTSTSK